MSSGETTGPDDYFICLDEIFWKMNCTDLDVLLVVSPCTHAWFTYRNSTVGIFYRLSCPCWLAYKLTSHAWIQRIREWCCRFVSFIHRRAKQGRSQRIRSQEQVAMHSDAAKGGPAMHAMLALTACAHLIKYIRNHRVLDTIKYDGDRCAEFLTSSSAKIIDK